jgi:hypothetical protein
MAHGKAEAFTTDFALLLQRSKCVDVTCRAAIGKRMAALARSEEPEVGEPAILKRLYEDRRDPQAGASPDPARSNRQRGESARPE